MERVKSKKLAAPAGHVPETNLVPANPPKGSAVQRVPARPVRDPADMTEFNTSSYGPHHEAFVLGKVPVTFRQKEDGESKVRLYYVGTVLAGVVTIGPVMITANWNNRRAEPYESLAKAEADLRTRLQAVP